MPDPASVDVNVLPIRQPTFSGETIDVELRPHIGIQPTRLGPVEVEHDQYIIMAGRAGDMVQVGYVGKQAGAPINWLRQPGGLPWPGPIKIAVRKAIAELLDTQVRREAEAPEIQLDEPEEDEDE